DAAPSTIDRVPGYASELSAPLLARKRIDWIELFAPDGVLLDLGCDRGDVVLAAKERGYEAYGAEPDAAAAASARARGADVVSGSIDDWRREFCGFQVDAVTMFHVLQRAADPSAMLASARASLCAGGALFVEVPNRDAGAKAAPAWPGTDDAG